MVNRTAGLTRTVVRYAGTLLVAFLCARTLGALYAATDVVQEFKYGSIGTEETVGVPYWLWRVLPEVFGDKLPDRPGAGYARLGFTYETPSSDR